MREFESRLFFKKESLQVTLQKTGQNRDSCDSDSRNQYNPKACETWKMDGFVPELLSDPLRQPRPRPGRSFFLWGCGGALARSRRRFGSVTYASPTPIPACSCARSLSVHAARRADEQNCQLCQRGRGAQSVQWVRLSACDKCDRE